jgi:hypothetical protein
MRTQDGHGASSPEARICCGGETDSTKIHTLQGPIVIGYKNPGGEEPGSEEHVSNDSVMDLGEGDFPEEIMLVSEAGGSN